MSLVPVGLDAVQTQNKKTDLAPNTSLSGDQPFLATMPQQKACLLPTCHSVLLSLLDPLLCSLLPSLFTALLSSLLYLQYSVCQICSLPGEMVACYMLLVAHVPRVCQP